MIRLCLFTFLLGIATLTAIFAGIAVIDAFVPIQATFQSRGVR